MTAIDRYNELEERRNVLSSEIRELEQQITKLKLQATKRKERKKLEEMEATYQSLLLSLKDTLEELPSAKHAADAEFRRNKLLEIKDVALQPYNEVIAKYDGFVLVERDDGELFYAEGLEEYVDIGDTVLAEELKPLSKLPKQKQRPLK